MRDQATSCYGMRIFQQEVARFNATTTMHIGMENTIEAPADERTAKN